MSDTHTEAVMNVHYGIHYNALSEKLFRRVKVLFEGVTLVTGSSAFAAWLSGNQSVAAWTGLSLSVIAALNLIVGPGEQSVRFNEAYRLFSNLLSRSSDMTLQKIDSEVTNIRSNAPWGLGAVSVIAYNRCLYANGYQDDDKLLPLSVGSRIVSWLI